MDKRTKILAIAFGSVIGAMALSKTVYPKWIEPLVNIDEEIATLEEELADLQDFDEKFQRARIEYREYAARAGSIVPLDVLNAVKSRLDQLVSDMGLKDAVVASPSRPSVDHKTKLASLKFHVEGEGSLRQVVETLRALEDLPYVLQVVNPKINRSSSGRRERNVDQMLLTTDVVLKVLPNHIMLNAPLTEARLASITPEVPPRHLREDYSMIWDRKPFFPWEPPPPPKPIRDPVRVTKRDDDPPPPEPPPDYRWKDARDYQVAVTSVVYNGARADQEVLLYNDRRKNTRYVGVGEDFDGGTLLKVHPRGVIVGREDGVFVYPIGESLTDAVQLAAADDHPELQAAFEKIPESLRAEIEQQNYESFKAQVDRSRFEQASFGVSHGGSSSTERAEPDRRSRSRRTPTRRTPSAKRRSTRLD